MCCREKNTRKTKVSHDHLQWTVMKLKCGFLVKNDGLNDISCAVTICRKLSIVEKENGEGFVIKREEKLEKQTRGRGA